MSDSRQRFTERLREFRRIELAAIVVPAAAQRRAGSLLERRTTLGEAGGHNCALDALAGDAGVGTGHAQEPSPPSEDSLAKARWLIEEHIAARKWKREHGQ